MKTTTKSLISMLILTISACSLAVEATASKLNPKQPDIMETLKKQTYSNVTLYDKDVQVYDLYTNKIIQINTSDKKSKSRISLYDGVLDCRDRLYTSYQCVFRNNNYGNYTQPYEAFQDVIKGKSTLHSRLATSEASKLTAGFLKAGDSFEPFVLIRHPNNIMELSPKFSGALTQKESIESFFAREDVRQELLCSSLDLRNTKVMILYCLPLFWDMEVMFYDDNSEFIMFMEDKKCEALGLWGLPSVHVVEKAGKVYSAAKIYPVNEVLEDLIYLSDEYTRKYGRVNTAIQGGIDTTIQPPTWVPW